MAADDDFKNATAEQLRVALKELRFCTRMVMDNMEKSPGGDAYTYEGSTSDADALREALDAAEWLWMETTPDDSSDEGVAP